MKIADIKIKGQEFGETTKEPGLVSKYCIDRVLIM
jgi:hypothetical protein